MQCQKLKSCESDDEFMKLRPNVNVTRLGKFYITLKTFKVTKEKDRKYTNKNVAHKEDKANVHEYRDDGGQV